MSHASDRSTLPQTEAVCVKRPAPGHERWYFVDPEHGEVLHRFDGPASVTPECEAYYEYGQLHRIGGPARVWTNGRREYYRRGLPHREDGPAVEGGDRDEYWLHGGFVPWTLPPCLFRYEPFRELVAAWLSRAVTQPTEPSITGEDLVLQCLASLDATERQARIADLLESRRDWDRVTGLRALGAMWEAQPVPLPSLPHLRSAGARVRW